MTKFSLSLSSSTYKNHILHGFSVLQQSDEFVDMTLAAEGHFVKAHQTIVALASPYLKELLRSVPCQHPVIYLNGVSHEELSFILEYIYRGELHIPAEKVAPFLKTAQALHIAGLKNIDNFSKDEETSYESRTTQFYKAEQPLCHIMDSTEIKKVNNCDLPIQEPFIEIPADENSIHQLAPSTLEPTLSTLKPILATIEPSLPKLELSLSEQNMEILNTKSLNSHGKSINVILDDSVVDKSIGQKPVAKIEIISNTLISKNLDPSNVHINNQIQVPQLYNKTLIMKPQDVLIQNNATNISMDTSASSSQIDLGKLLNMEGKFLLPQYTTSEDIIMSDFSDYNNVATGYTMINNTEAIKETVKNENETGAIAYTVSNRGALQMILNEFMYYCHYQRDNGRKKRWRCINYRDAQCRASVDTDGEQIEARKHQHCHPNHTDKIRRKIDKNKGMIFPTLQKAENILNNKKKAA